MHYTTTPLPAPTRGQPHDCAAANPTPTPNTGPATLQSAMFSKRSLAINAPSSSPCHHHPRRAVMYVPGSDERKVAKATGLSVDCLVYDIEDGVAVSQKVCAPFPEFHTLVLPSQLLNGVFVYVHWECANCVYQ